MSHWAEIDENNTVIRVIVGPNNIVDEGYHWIVTHLGGKWIKTSYNTHAGIHKNGNVPLRKNYAGIGYLYDLSRDAFIPPKPFNSWLLNEDTCLWEAPVSYPNDEKKYTWNEDNQTWEEVVEG